MSVSKCCTTGSGCLFRLIGGGGADGVGQRLRQLRTERGVSQVQLAAHAHLAAPSFLSHIEAGRKQPAVLVRLADALGVTVDDLLGAG